MEVKVVTDPTTQFKQDRYIRVTFTVLSVIFTRNISLSLTLPADAKPQLRR
jgi:hypothetical protein